MKKVNWVTIVCIFAVVCFVIALFMMHNDQELQAILNKPVKDATIREVATPFAIMAMFIIIFQK